LHFKTANVNLHKDLTIQQQNINQLICKLKGLLMKKMLSVAAIIATGLFASQASAAVMECFVDTQAYDHFTEGYCGAIVSNVRSTTAVFRVTGTSKPINSVIWSEKASSCGTSGTSCSITIYPFHEYTAKATVLYQDGTWDTASAIAMFEDGR
jgi:hypothetical protein